MSIENDVYDGAVRFGCDNCYTESETNGDDFHIALAQIKTDGWLVTKHKDDWVHFCSDDCKKEYCKEDGASEFKDIAL